MKNVMLMLFIVVAMISALPTAAANNAATAFTYQGKLTDSAGVPLTGPYNMTFKLYDALTSGNQIGSNVTLSGVSVAAGLFTVSLDFGAASFNGGADRWLETTIGTATLAPRVKLTTVPSAIYAQTVPWSGITGAPTSLPPSGAAGGDLTGTYPNPTIGTGTVTSTKILDGTVALADMATGSVDSTKIVDGSIALADMAVNSVDATKIVDGSVASADLASDAASLNKVTAGAANVSSGNIGIGVTPTTKLDVNGTAKMTGFQLGTTATAGQVLTASATGVGTWQALPTSLPPSGSAGGDLIGTYPNPTITTGAVTSTKILDGTIALADMAANSVDASKIVDGAVASAELTSDATSFAKVSGGAAAVSSGNVGIGTATPAAKLDVAGTTKMTGFQLGTAATAGQVLTASATGVGTWQALPNSLPSGAAGGDLTGTYPNPTVGTAKIDNTKLASDAASLSKVTGGAASVSSGNVGIGTTMPTAKLDVNGSANATTLSVQGSAGSDALAVVWKDTLIADAAYAQLYNVAYDTSAKWQSFTALATGNLSAIDLKYTSQTLTPWTATLRIYSGEGTSGTILTTQTISGTGDYTIWNRCNLTTRVSVTAGSKYTIWISSGSASGWYYDDASVTGRGYSGGVSELGGNIDHVFQTWLTEARPNVVVQSDTGNVGIGTDTPSTKLHVVGASSLMGNVGVNTTSPAQTLDVNGTAHISGNVALSGNVYIDALPSGDRRNVQWDATTHQLYQAVSSRRYKDNIETLVDDFSKFLHLEPKTYTYKTAPDVHEIGYIAEDVDALGIKWLVHYDQQGRPDALKYEKMVIYLNEVVKSQQKQIEEQQKQIVFDKAEKDTKIDNLQKQIDELKKLITVSK